MIGSHTGNPAARVHNTSKSICAYSIARFFGYVNAASCNIKTYTATKKQLYNVNCLQQFVAFDRYIIIKKWKRFLSVMQCANLNSVPTIQKRFDNMDRSKKVACLQRFVEQLYEEHKGLLLSTILRYLGSPTDCEDVFHEVFIRIIGYADKLIEFPDNKVKAYILLVAHGVCVDYLRKQYRTPEISMDHDVLMNMVNTAEAPHKEFDAFNRADLLMIMDSVSTEDRTLLIGKYYLGLSGEELADIVGGSEVAVRSQLHRAKKKVFSEWKKAGLHLEDFE